MSMGGRGIFRHQVLCNQPRKRPIDPAPHVDFGKFFKSNPVFSLRSLLFAREVRLFGVRLRADGHIFASGH